MNRTMGTHRASQISSGAEWIGGEPSVLVFDVNETLAVRLLHGRGARLGHDRGAKRWLHRGPDHPAGNAPLPARSLPRPNLLAPNLPELAEQLRLP